VKLTSQLFEAGTTSGVRKMQLGILGLRHAVVAVAALNSLSGCTTAPSNAKTSYPQTALASRSAASAASAPASAPPRKAAGVTKAPTRWSMSERDRTLRIALERWSQEAGWRLLWELGVDYRLEATSSIEGTFEEAISTVVTNMDRAEVPPKAIFYRGNQVLRVVARGME
jgi:Toxin co-regulated pilus biosynthesis protein Q